MLGVEPDMGLDLMTKIITWAKTKSQTLNRLSHPGAPDLIWTETKQNKKQQLWGSNSKANKSKDTPASPTEYNFKSWKECMEHILKTLKYKY